MNALSKPPKPDRPVKSCSICNAPAAQSFMPFCSRRCADIDLGRWLDGHYVIEGEDGMSSEPEDDGENR